MEGIEPPTDALQKHYSTTELHWQLTKLVGVEGLEPSKA